MLPSLAAAQAQNVVIATVGSVSYAAQGAIDWPLALLVGVPVAVGVVIGWKIARTIPTRPLKLLLVVVLFAVAAYLMLR